MKAAPKISVGMPVHNGGNLLEESIKSVLDQTFTDFEFHIADNCSSDGTEDLCRQYAKLDGRIVYHRHPQNIGAAKNFNFLVGVANAPYFRWSNADDLLHPSLHAECFAVLSQAPEDVVLIYGKTQLINEQGEKIEDYEDNLCLEENEPWERFSNLLERVRLVNVLYGLIRTDVLRKTELMGDGTVPASDVDLIAELAMHGKFSELPKHLFFRRMHPAASSAMDVNQVLNSFWGSSEKQRKYKISRKYTRYLRSIARLDGRWAPKSRMYKAVARRALMSRHRLVNELVHWN